MDTEKCRIELKPDEKLGWKMEATGQCKTLLEAINKNQGPYSKNYLNQRFFIIEEAVQPASSERNTE